MNRVSVNISAYRTIHKMAQDCLDYKNFYIATGESGFGKTFACQDFAQINKRNVVHVELRRSESASVFFAKLTNSIGDMKIKASIKLSELIDIAAEKFISSSSNMLLIIDQVNKLNPKMCEYLHEFRDLTKENTGILLIGTTAFKESLDTWAEGNYSGIREFRSRVQNEIEIPEPDASDVISIIQAHGINNKDFENAYRDIKNLHSLYNKIVLFDRAFQGN